MKKTISIICLGMAFALPGCGGGSPGVAPSPPPPPPPVATAAGGIWYGSLQFDNVTTSEEAMALVAEDGRFRIVSLDSDVALVGGLGISQTPFGIGGRLHIGMWGEEADYYVANIRGSVSDRESLSMWWTTPQNIDGDLEFTYESDLYERDSSLALLAGSWTGYEDDGRAWMTVTIDADGNFTAEDAGGCGASGQFAMIDSGFNLYDVLNVGFGCDTTGTGFSGLAHLDDLGDVPYGALFLSMDNGAEALRVSVERD